MKILPLLIIALMATNALYSQQKFEIGLEGGPSIATMRGNSILEERTTSRFGFLGGLSLQYNISKNIAIRSGIGFARKGAYSIDSFNIFDSTSGTFNSTGVLEICSDFDYISIPLLMRFTFGNKKIKYFANGGAYLTFLTKQLDRKSGTLVFASANDVDGTGNFNEIDYGLSLGLGARYSISQKLDLSLELRNDLGLSDISALPTFQNGGIKTSALNLLVGISYGIGKDISQNLESNL